MSRQAQAFNALLEEEDDGGPSRSKPRGKGRASAGAKSGQSQVPGFKLREGSAAAQAPVSSSSPPSDLDHLVQLFDGALPRDVVADVYAACGRSKDAALDALLGMGAASQGPSIAATPPSAPAAPPAERPPCFWDALPEECKLIILDLLSLKDLARAAGTSREFATHVRAQRRSLCVIAVPPKLSGRAVRGLVAAYPEAPAVDLSRCATSLRFSNEFEDAFAAIAAGVADRCAAGRGQMSLFFQAGREISLLKLVDN